MLQIVYRVVLGGVWLVIGLGMLFAKDLLPERMVAGRDAAFLNLFGLLALLLAVYNVMRLVAYLRRRAAQARLNSNPLRPAPAPDAEPPPPRPRQYIPELDFTNSGPPAEPKPEGERPA